MLPSNQPFFSHATKSLALALQILQCGELRSPSQLPYVRRFSAYADDYFGRSGCVMFAAGCGYLVDNANMKVAFLFSADLLDLPETEVHLQPVTYAVCHLIAEAAKREQRDHWIDYFTNPPTALGEFDHPLCPISFHAYMQHYFSANLPEAEYGGAWGVSTFSRGVIQLLYEQNSLLKLLLDDQIAAFLQRNRLQGAAILHAFFDHQWGNLPIYYTLGDAPLNNRQKCHVQVLCHGSVSLTAPHTIGIAVKRDDLPMFQAMMRDLFASLPWALRRLPVYTEDQRLRLNDLA